MPRQTKRPTRERTNKTTDSPEMDLGLGGFFSGLGSLIEKLGDLAEKGEELRESGEIGEEGSPIRGVYGFTIKTGIGGDAAENRVKVEPFGNVRKDERTGKARVHEVIEPMVDVFEEDDHLLVVAEMPGIGDDDVTLELDGDILNITATRGRKKYHKELLLPGSFGAEDMTRSCRNGVLEVKFVKERSKNA